MIEESIGEGDISSSEKTLENYKLQYEALKGEMVKYPNNKFVIWTGAALIAGETSVDYAERADEFFTWVKEDWDEDGDNIFVWDFRDFETDGGIYMKDNYAQGDSHPTESFAAKIAPFFGQRLVDIIEDRGDSGSLTGEK